ncbi:MAG: hypothetical protein OXC60_05855 [Litoreibacter sp.]|nr:hypothetical protein [Litoreibacter sp.]
MADGFHQLIQKLAGAGVATHMIQNPASVDSVFAVAKVQELPGITFAAGFEDGSLAIGCHGDLPDILVEMASPIELERESSDTVSAEDAPQAPEPAFDGDAFAEKLKADILEAVQSTGLDEKLAAILENVSSDNETGNPKDDIGTELLARLEALETRFADANPETQLSRMERLLAALHRRPEINVETLTEKLDGLGASMSGTLPEPHPSAIGDLADQLARLEERLSPSAEMVHDAASQVSTALMEMQQNAPAMPDLSGLEDKIAALGAEITALSAKTSEPQDAPDLSGLETRLSQLSDEMGKIGVTVTDKVSALEPARLDLSPLELHLDSLGHQINDLPVASLQEAVSRIEAQLGASSVSDEAENADLSEINEKLAVMLGIDRTIQSLAAQVADLASRDTAPPEPVLNEAEPIQAQIENGFTGIRDMLEALNTTPVPEPDPRFGEILKLLERSQDASDAGETQSTSLEEIARKLDELAARPAPQLNISGLKHNQTQFASTQAEAINRLETLCADLTHAQVRLSEREAASPDDGIAPALTELRSAILTRLEELAAQFAPEFDLGPVLTRLDDLLGRPMTETDITPLLQDQARFEASQAEMISQIQSLMSKLETPKEEESPEPQALDLSPVMAALDQMSQAQLSAFDGLQEQLKTLAGKEAPDFDTGELTGLLTALSDQQAQANRELKAAVSALRPISEPEDDTLELAETPSEKDQLIATLESLAVQFDNLAAQLHGDADTEAVIFRASAKTREMDPSPSKGSPQDLSEADGRMSLDVLSTRIAEMLTQHLFETETATAKPNGTSHY